MDAQAWTDFFKDAGLGPDVAATYGNIFFMNKIERSHLPYLNREVLGEMNISVLGHVLMILKHARLVSDRVECSTSAAVSATTSSESEDQVSPAVAIDQECERFEGPDQNLEVLSQSNRLPTVSGAASKTDTQPEVQQCQSGSCGTSPSLKYSAPLHKQDFVIEGSEVAEMSGANQCNMQSTKEDGRLTHGGSQADDCGHSSQLVTQQTVNAEKAANSLDSDGVEGKDDSSEQHSPLLPTPVMPHNWFNPSRKPFESGGDDTVASDMSAFHYVQYESNLGDEERKQGGKSRPLAYSQENEPERPLILPEKICSPLLPTPVMPENWLDPSRRSTDSSFTSFSDISPFLRSEYGGDLSASSFLQETNMNLNDHYISSSGTTYTDPPYPQASMYPSDNRQSQNSSTFDPYYEYNDQSIQERNFKAKSNMAWNKQVRQTQPYFRPPPQPGYGVSSYSSQPNERPVFQNNAPGAFTTNSGYMYNTQSANERREVHQWKY